MKIAAGLSCGAARALPALRKIVQLVKGRYASRLDCGRNSTDRECRGCVARLGGDGRINTTGRLGGRYSGIGAAGDFGGGLVWLIMLDEVVHLAAGELVFVGGRGGHPRVAVAIVPVVRNGVIE
ncbi:MAG: hypothetical protein AAF799_05975 [Myxococcota bacterium]